MGRAAGHRESKFKWSSCSGGGCVQGMIIAVAVVSGCWVSHRLARTDAQVPVGMAVPVCGTVTSKVLGAAAVVCNMSMQDGVVCLCWPGTKIGAEQLLASRCASTTVAVGDSYCPGVAGKTFHRNWYLLINECLWR